MKNVSNERAEVRCGLLGGAIPLIAFFLAIIVFSIYGIRGTKSYWSAGVVAMIISFFIFKDKDQFQKAVVDGVRDEVFVMSLLALYFAGILSKTLTAGHLVNGLMWAASEVNLSPAIMPLATFVITAAIATASGTSSGSVATMTPVMLPLCVSMGCSAEIICGAIVSGAYFGDNLAPVSDTTIASAMTQEVSLGKVVRSRLKYSITGAVFASIMFYIFGGAAVDVGAAATIKADASYAISVAYVILPILVVVLMICGKNLLTSLLLTDLIGMIMLLVLRDAGPVEILSAGGLIVSGIEGMQGATILMMFAFIMNSLTRSTGFMDRMIDFVRMHAKTPRSSECGIAAFICCLMIATGGNTASIAVTGPMARRIMRPFRVARERTANILDGMTSGVGCFVPHSPANATMASLAVSLGVVANESFSAFDYAKYNFHGMALIAIFWLAIFTGWGRRIETAEELLADGIEVE
ncbi:Na+/H+ antiporter NhaC family protein [Synergistes jonesii]|uniref:Na+/H+ antiporter NhaC family protein n=1 Tax=Synergistes jonesii TaxID=2754 RepID=UPI00248E977A|nr:Na+/H+ antiporter NhaC family protein [Synergistes jonesii]